MTLNVYIQYKYIYLFFIKKHREGSALSVHSYQPSLIDTPGILNAGKSTELVKKEMITYIELSTSLPGPHLFTFILIICGIDDWCTYELICFILIYLRNFVWDSSDKSLPRMLVIRVFFKDFPFTKMMIEILSVKETKYKFNTV